MTSSSMSVWNGWTTLEAVACDMNSDFQEAFEEKCPHIQPVFDYFHIVKNFNDKVVSEIRKDEQRRLYDEGNFEGARQLKRSKYILTSSRKTLREEWPEARDGKVISKGSEMFCRKSTGARRGMKPATMNCSKRTSSCSPVISSKRL